MHYDWGMSTSNRPTIHLMVGLPYSGKSTYIRNPPTLSALSVVDSDSYIEKKAKAENTSYGAIFDREIEAALTFLRCQAMIRNYWLVVNVGSIKSFRLRF